MESSRSTIVEVLQIYKGNKPPSELKLVKARSVAGAGVAALATLLSTGLGKVASE